MSFVATKEQVEAFTTFSQQPSFSQEAINVSFMTTREFVSSILPPGFEPADKPVGMFSISQWGSPMMGSFDCTWASFACKYKGIEGSYSLFIYIGGEEGSSELAITWGREVWGDPKKKASSRLFRNGTHRSGTTVRMGTTLMEIEADFTTDLPALKQDSVAFEVKAYPHSSGLGLHDEARVIALNVTEDYPIRATGKGKVIIRGTNTNPLHTIPIVNVEEITYVSGTVDYKHGAEYKLGCGDAYLPYLLGKGYDNLSSLRADMTLEEKDNMDSKVFPARVYYSQKPSL